MPTLWKKYPHNVSSFLPLSLLLYSHKATINLTYGEADKDKRLPDNSGQTTWVNPMLFLLLIFLLFRNVYRSY